MACEGDIAVVEKQYADAHLGDQLQGIEAVVLAVEAQLHLAVRALTQRLDHHILVHKRAALQHNSKPALTDMLTVAVHAALSRWISALQQGDPTSKVESP